MRFDSTRWVLYPERARSLAVRLEHPAQRRQPLRRLGEMMQHAVAHDDVEQTQAASIITSIVGGARLLLVGCSNGGGVARGAIG